ncbi:MAG: hypothetical protein J0G95_06350 [Rhizobiales bacterium]|nr:hypothetical protein [Hyphomicrobiales bacterium]
MSINGEVIMDSGTLKNITFDEIQVGASASLTYVAGRDDIALFAAVPADVNPAHMSPKYAATGIFGHIVVHGMWTGALMAARGQITGAKVDGPRAFDSAINLDAAKTKGILSPVAGQADILLVPDLEAGNMLAKQLTYFAGAIAAAVFLGARVPIVLTSRFDSLTARIASAALARLVAAPGAAKGLPS